jgi:hypothetical protein
MSMLRRRAWSALLAAAAALVLTGCRLTASYDFSVRPDGLVDIRVTLLADRELITTLRMPLVLSPEGSKKIDLEKEAEEMVADVNKNLSGLGIKAKPVVRGDEAGAAVELKGLTPAKVEEALGALWGAMLSNKRRPGPKEASPGISFTLRSRPGLWSSSGEFRLEIPLVDSQAMGILTTEVRLKVPGKVTGTNGTAFGPDSVRWSHSGPTPVSAWATYSVPNWPVRAAVIAAAVALACVSGALLVRRSGRSRRCPVCGAKVRGAAKFCTSCGASLD